MADTKQNEYEIDESVNVQLLALFHDATENIRLAKRQQWYVAYYAILFYAAVIFTSRYVLTPENDWAFWFLVALLVAILAVSLFGLWRMRSWMRTPRRWLQEIRDHMSPQYQKIVGERNESAQLMHGSDIVVLLTVVTVIAGGVTVWVLVARWTMAN